MRTIVFDTEATDLVPGQLCQLSALVVTDDQAGTTSISASTR